MPAGSPLIWPTGGTRWPSPAVSTSGSRAPSVKMPTWPCGCWPTAGNCAGATGTRSTRCGQPRPWPPARAVLFDRDGTLIRDVPYNGDPALVEPMPGAAAAVAAARRRGLRIGMITNQSGIARGLVSRAGAEAVNARVAALLGPFDVVQMCPHGPMDGCVCRKPAPGMVLAAAADV